MTRRNRTLFFWFMVWLILATTLVFVVATYFPVSYLVSYLIAVNLSAFLLYGWDKLSAGQGIDRVPELILYLTVLSGGGVGSLLGMNLFHHKTKKLSFQFVVGLIILVQLGLLVLIWSKKVPVIKIF